MTLQEKLDRTVTGFIGGFALPLIIVSFMFLFAKGDPPLDVWLMGID